MEALECREHILTAIRRVASYHPEPESIQVDVITDESNGHYQVVYRGWKDKERIYVVLVHLRLQGNTIYVERDGTSDGVATYLLEAGVPHEQIVMAVHPPDMRHLTAFATG